MTKITSLKELARVLKKEFHDRWGFQCTKSILCEACLITERVLAQFRAGLEKALCETPGWNIKYIEGLRRKVLG